MNFDFVYDFFTANVSLLVILLAVGVSIAGATFALVQFIRASKNVHGYFKVMILQHRPYGYVRIAQKKVRADRQDFQHGGNTYVINPAKVAYHNPLPVLLYEAGNPEPLVMTWKKEQSTVNSSVVHEVLSNSVIKQIILSARKPPVDYLMMIVFVVMGALIGFIIGQYVPLVPHTTTPTTAPRG